MNSYMPSDRLLYQSIETKLWTANIDLYIPSGNQLHEPVHTQSRAVNIGPYAPGGNRLHRPYTPNRELLYGSTIWKWKSTFGLYIIRKVLITWDDTWPWPSGKRLGLLPVMTNPLVTRNFMKRNPYSVWGKAAGSIPTHVILFFGISFRLRVLA